MQPARHPVSRHRHARRLAVSSVVLASLAGTALGFQGTAAAVGLGRTRLTEPIPKAAPGCRGSIRASFSWRGARRGRCPLARGA